MTQRNINLFKQAWTGIQSITAKITGTNDDAVYVEVSDTTAAAADVASGKYFYNASGVRTAGTNSGGGGGSGLTLLATKSLGTISTSSTTAADTGQTVSVPNAGDYDFLIVQTYRQKTNSRHLCTIAVIELYSTADAEDGRSSATIATAKMNMKVDSNGHVGSRVGTTAYGIYPNSCSISGGDGTLAMYERYNSTSTGTINGSYTTDVYGINMLDLII